MNEILQRMGGAAGIGNVGETVRQVSAVLAQLTAEVRALRAEIHELNANMKEANLLNADALKKDS